MCLPSFNFISLHMKLRGILTSSMLIAQVIVFGSGGDILDFFRLYAWVELGKFGVKLVASLRVRANFSTAAAAELLSLVPAFSSTSLRNSTLSSKDAVP